MIGERIVNIPSYTVTTTEEDNIRFTPESKFPEILEKGKEKPVETTVESEDSAEQKEEVKTEEKTTPSAEPEVEKPSAE
jgi:small subunit ribosomal protein S4